MFSLKLKPDAAQRTTADFDCVASLDFLWQQISVMQRTFRIDDALYRRAKAKAASLGISLTQFLEEALQLAPRQHRP